MLGFIKRLFCRHELEFNRNIHGDEINLSGGKRSVWWCTKCDAVVLKSELWAHPVPRQVEALAPATTCVHPSWSVDEAGKCTTCGQPDEQATPEPRKDEARRLIDTLRNDARGGRAATVHDLDAAANLIEASLTATPEGWREVIEKMVKGIDHLAELARQWEPDHSSGADRKGWVLAKNARDEAVDMLAAAQAKGGESA